MMHSSTGFVQQRQQSQQQILLQDTVTGQHIPAHVHYLFSGEHLSPHLEQHNNLHAATIDLNNRGRVIKTTSHISAYTIPSSQLSLLTLEPPSEVVTIIEDARADDCNKKDDDNFQSQYTSMDLDQSDEITDKHISKLLDEFHSNNDKISSLLSDNDLRSLLNYTLIESPSCLQQQPAHQYHVLLKRRSKHNLTITTERPVEDTVAKGADTNNGFLQSTPKCKPPSFNLVSPYKCNNRQETPTHCSSLSQGNNSTQLQSPLRSPFKGGLIPFNPINNNAYNASTPLNSKEKVEKKIQEALESMRRQVTSALSMADEESLFMLDDQGHHITRVLEIKDQQAATIDNGRRHASKRRLDFPNADEKEHN